MEKERGISYRSLDTALVLTSDDVHSIFPPPSCLTPPLVALLQNS